MYAYYRLPEDGFEVDVAGPQARLYRMVLHEIPPTADPPWDVTRERPGYHIQATLAFAADCIHGRTVTTVAKCALDARQGGATYVDRPCVVDGNLVTARTWHDNTLLLKNFVRMLKDASDE